MQRELYDLAEAHLVEQYGPDYEAVLDEMATAEREKRDAEIEAERAKLSPEERAAIPPGIYPDEWLKLSPDAQSALAAIAGA